MIMSQERAFLKAQEQLDALEAYVEQAADSGSRIDQVERELFGRLLNLGRTLMTAFVASQGDGDAGSELETADGRRVRRMPEPLLRVDGRDLYSSGCASRGSVLLRRGQAALSRLAVASRLVGVRRVAPVRELGAPAPCRNGDRCRTRVSKSSGVDVRYVITRRDYHGICVILFRQPGNLIDEHDPRAGRKGFPLTDMGGIHP